MLKYKICVLFLFIISLYCFDFVNANNNFPLLGKVIYLDPGHGGLDPGAIYGGINEKDINLEISKKIEEKLSKLGAIVYMTRYGDYDLSVNNTINRKRSDLSRRSNIINKSNCDLFLSIHLNAEETNSYRGAQAFYAEKNEKNIEIAKIFQEEFKKSLNSTRNYKKDNTLYLQKRLKVPGVLLEVGFLSNPNERYLLKQETYQNKIAETIVSATLTYFH